MFKFRKVTHDKEYLEKCQDFDFRNEIDSN